jgi:hypothetical protein
MGGAEIAALQAGAADMHPDRHEGLPQVVKDPHGTHPDAGAAFAAPVLVNVHLDGEGSRGIDLQGPPYLPAFCPARDPACEGRNKQVPPSGLYKSNSLFFRRGQAFQVAFG